MACFVPRVPPGYHFDPSDEELITFFLLDKALGKQLRPCCIVERQLYGDNANPWDVFDDVNDPWETEKSNSDQVTKKTIYAITKLSKITAGGKRISRSAGCGLWNGKSRVTTIVDSNGIAIGSKKMLSFETKTGVDSEIIKNKHGHWIMHEYYLDGAKSNIINGVKLDDSYVICKITRSLKGADLGLLGSKKRQRTVDDYPNENKKARMDHPSMDDVPPAIQEESSSAQVIDPPRLDDCGQWAFLDEIQDIDIDINISDRTIDECIDQLLMDDQPQIDTQIPVPSFCLTHAC